MCSKIFFLLSSVVFIKAKWTIAVCILVCRKMRPIYLRPFIWDHDIWDHIHLRPHSHETFSFETTFTWDHIHLSPHSFQIISIWDHIHLTPHSFETKLIWDHIHLRSHSFETTFIWDYIHLRPHLFETIHLRPHSLETTFIVDHIHFRSHSFYAMSKWSCFDLLWMTFLWSTFHFFAGDLKFCNVTPFRVQGDSRWIVNALALQNTAETRKLFIPRAWKGALLLWNVMLLHQVKELYVLHSCPFPLSKRHNIFSF